MTIYLLKGEISGLSVVCIDNGNRIDAYQVEPVELDRIKTLLGNGLPIGQILIAQKK